MGTLFATSIGQSDDSSALGRTLTTEATGKLGKAPNLAVVFASSTQNYARLLKGVRDALGNTPMIGCSTAGEFTEERISKSGAACALIASDTMRFSLGLGKNLRASPEQAFEQALANLPLSPQPEYPHRTALLLMDGLTGSGDDVMAAAQQRFGADVFVAGGAAGDNLAFHATHVFYNWNIYTDALLCCLIHSKTPLRPIVTHGHFPFNKVMTVTKSDKNRVYQIDQKNAWEVWKEATLPRRKEASFTDEVLDNPASLSQFFPHFEMGIIEHETIYKLRAILTKQADGSLDFAGHVPEGSKFRVMYSDQASQLISMERAAKFAKASMKHPTVGALIFDCAARSAVLGDEFYRSLQTFTQTFEKMPFLGFETYGEMCSDAFHFHGFLNGTCVMLLIPD